MRLNRATMRRLVLVILRDPDAEQAEDEILKFPDRDAKQFAPLRPTVCNTLVWAVR